MNLRRPAASRMAGPFTVLLAVLAPIVLEVRLVRAQGQGPVTQQFLNENCTISVLNRNVQAKPDGSWVLPNVPANFGPVRARATCIVDGRTISGESAPFNVPANGVVNVPQIIFG